MNSLIINHKINNIIIKLEDKNKVKVLMIN